MGGRIDISNVGRPGDGIGENVYSANGNDAGSSWSSLVHSGIATGGTGTGTGTGTSPRVNNNSGPLDNTTQNIVEDILNSFGVYGVMLQEVHITGWGQLVSAIRAEAYQTSFYSYLNAGNQRGTNNEATIAKTFLTGNMQTLPYSMSNKPGTIDCSRCTMQIAAQAGYNIPRTAYEQAKWYQENGTWSTDLKDALPGDHIFWLRAPGQYRTGVISDISPTG